MNETIVALSVLGASLFLTVVDPSKSALLEYVVVSLIGYICGRVTQRVKCDVERCDCNARDNTSGTRSE